MERQAIGNKPYALRCRGMSYLFLKSFHIISAMMTISGFLLRGFLMLRESEMLQHRFVRVAPHVVDTVFLLSGIAMLWLLHLNQARPNEAGPYCRLHCCRLDVCLHRRRGPDKIAARLDRLSRGFVL